MDYYGLVYHIDVYIHITYFSFCGIWNSKQYRVIFWYSPTPSQQVSASLFRSNSIQLLSWLIFFVDWLYWVLANIFIAEFLCYLLLCFHDWNFTTQKHIKTISCRLFVVPGASLHQVERLIQTCSDKTPYIYYIGVFLRWLIIFHSCQHFYHWIFVLLIIMFSYLKFYNTKTHLKILVIYLPYRVRASEPQVNLRD